MTVRDPTIDYANRLVTLLARIYRMTDIKY